MGGSFSKKSNVVLLKKSETSNLDFTPKAKILSFDPRSPGEGFNRTPIVVSNNSKDLSTPQPPLKKLDIDCRSPLPDVGRTPILVPVGESSSSPDESLSASKKDSSEDRKSSLANICTSANPATGDEDPRSPSGTVPRTPLYGKAFDISAAQEKVTEELKKHLSFNESGDQEGGLDPSDGPPTPKREPLANIMNNPKNILQAKQCKSVENEFNKSSLKNKSTDEEQINKSRTNQLTDDQENSTPIRTSTQFVEII